ncbi:hypothetical protein H5V45_14720 [Nocardioides sp. KIGAM211]|uniref:4-hydroxybenzoate polyprenyltransferase n=1 Tax=Nocardioides luti TaxID=2761101 RepID=A0A7X0RHT5_9ACTN|nr:hypothetical protein [Nocardioides luti]MBB6628576.1 hypothetical protein [Nocardioides luti]
MVMTRRARKKKDLPDEGVGAAPAAASATAADTASGTAPAPRRATGATTTEPLATAVTAPVQPQRRAGRRLSLGTLGPVLLLRAGHPRQAVVTALGVAAAAALAGRTTRELGLVFVTVLVGQTILGWHNDIVDAARDRRHELAGKPVALGQLDAGTVWFALIVGVLLVVPLSVANGVTAGSAYLVSLVVGLLGNVALRRGLLSWLPWAVSFALLPAFLSYGGWGGDATGNPPEIAITVLAALLGVCVHVLRALPGLVPDNADGWKHLPLRLALRTGATKLLVLGSVATAIVVAALLLTGNAVGLSQ